MTTRKKAAAKPKAKPKRVPLHMMKVMCVIQLPRLTGWGDIEYPDPENRRSVMYRPEDTMEDEG